MKNLVFLFCVFFSVQFISCVHEPFGPPNINLKVIDEELLSYMLLLTDDPQEDEVNCIEFNYSFIIYIFDAQMNFEEARSVFSNESFINLLNNLGEEQSISISYPITGTLSNGEPVSINTNEELLQAIKECSQEQIRAFCNNIIVKCNWVIKPVEDFPNEFEESTLQLYDDSKVKLFHNSAIYYGTWITLYIGDTLYINIDFNDDEDVEAFWDYNWDVLSLTSDEITISNEQNIISIEKDCNELCEPDSFEVCELEENQGFAEFNLSTYTRCIAIEKTLDPFKTVQFTFYETEENAINEIASIEDSLYTNIENPQTIYARSTYKTSGELIEITPVSINAVPCDD